LKISQLLRPESPMLPQPSKAVEFTADFVDRIGFRTALQVDALQRHL
jgi:hypothetical protein